MTDDNIVDHLGEVQTVGAIITERIITYGNGLRISNRLVRRMKK